MQIRLLGAVTVKDDNRTHALRSQSARTLLALTAWRCNEYISDEKAIGDIWGDEPPQHARDALYTCASRIRRTLSHAAGGVQQAILTRRRGGYCLHIDPDQIDLHQFRALVSRARTALHSANDLLAIEDYESAQALWSGALMADINSPWAARARITAGQEWLSAETERISAALRLQRHSEVIPRLYQLADDYPLDETIASMLMLALHQSGRTAEALASFSRIRREMIMQLGDGPGPELRSLHHQVLRRQNSSFAVG
ncbi:AfsR/SARP family transcriptional regulator [Streptomyces sp. NPDC002589]|uniref:AfsR/SARP family transcriptional regulator n=1 Tax=Streptomyces sp. NPDC002589 TaxID=3154420 RepID=UPI00332362CA